MSREKKTKPEKRERRKRKTFFQAFFGNRFYGKLVIIEALFSDI